MILKTPPIAIISLKNARDRREFMRKQLNSYGLDYWIFDAVDGNLLNNLPLKIYDSNRAIKCCKRELTKNEIACIMSHINIWSFFLNGSHENILIFEDDAILDKNFPIILKELKKFPNDWDMINFCSSQGQYELLEHTIETYMLKKFTSKMNGAVAYILNRKTATHCMQQVYPIRTSTDGLLASLCQTKKINCYGTSPEVVYVDDFKFPSLIGMR